MGASIGAAVTVSRKEKKMEMKKLEKAKNRNMNWE